MTLTIDEAGSDDAFDALADYIVPVTTADDDSVADEGLIAYWPLDEENGITTQDATGNGHTGTLSGGVSFTSGVFNNGVEFDGNDGTITFGNIDYQFSDSLTVALWTRFSGTDTYYQAIIHKAPYCYPFSIRRYDTRLRLAIRTDNGMGYLLSTARLPRDTWHHVATTYQDGSLSLYIDGQLDSELAVSGSLLESPENTTMGNNEAANIPFNGGLDEVYIYNRALNASEIQSLMSGPVIETAGFTVTESSGNTSVTESGSTDTFDVVLTAQPESDVVLTITSGDIGEITVDQASLTFTPADWDIPQTVTVTGQDDSLVDGDQTTVITLSVDDAQSDDQFDGVLDQTISVTTTDDDIPAGLTVIESDGTTEVSESGTTDSFQVLLDIRPSTDVVINITSGDTGEATVDLSSLTFTPADWNTPQTVTVSGQDDSLIDGDQTTVITLSVDDAQSDDQFDGVLDQTISVITTDDDTTPGFTVIESDGTTRVSESGTTDSFQVVLDAEPDSNVVIQVTGSGAREATVDQSSLTFTPANWHTPQTVTVTGQDDNWIDGDQTTLITLSIDDASSDNNFDDLSDQTVSVTTTDNDAAGLTITQTGNGTSVSESGTTDSFQVVLDAEPETDVVINITSSDIGDVTVDPTSLTFSPGSWDTPQTVFVTGVDDNVLDNDQVTNVTLTIDEAGSDDAFDALADYIVPVTTADDDS
ncbi:MAG: LamG domain-containing protein, partial [Planctomycetota bacterium]